MPTSYPTSFNDGQWFLLQPLLPPAKAGGRPHSTDLCQVDSATMLHHDVGVDGNKKVKGRKRHILTDSLCLLMVAVVTAANVPDAQGLRLVLEKLRGNGSGFNLTRCYLLYVDGGYRGQALLRWVMDTFGVILEMVLRPAEKRGFHVIPRRWVVERTFGWFYWCRRLSRDYECSTKSAEAWIYLASIRLLLRRLA